MEKIVSLCKRRGFVYPSSEIYGGFGGFYDYGPLGVELKNNIKREWWKKMVYEREDVVGLDASIIMNPKVWEASGHVEAFADPLVECLACHHRFRADHIQGQECPDCSGKLSEPKKFNLLMDVGVGVMEGSKREAYLRGEITQGVHVNFKNVLDTTSTKIPFGVAQIGKAFRNEITPGNFIYRMREFEQMELQFYVKPEIEEGKKWFEYFKSLRMGWYQELGIKKENLRFRDHENDERAHYAQAATDVEYNAPFGWSEFEGIHHRGDWDLSRHAKYSGQDLSCFDQASKQSIVPWVIETSAGADRVFLFFLLDAFHQEGERLVLSLHPKLAPIKAAVFPLVSNKPDIYNKAHEVYEGLKKLGVNIAWDDRGNIGKRYYAQDEAGTPWCVTVDYQTLEDSTVTVRDRDTAKQERIGVDELKSYLLTKLS